MCILLHYTSSINPRAASQARFGRYGTVPRTVGARRKRRAAGVESVCAVVQWDKRGKEDRAVWSGS